MFYVHKGHSYIDKAWKGSLKYENSYFSIRMFIVFPLKNIFIYTVFKKRKEKAK